MAAVCLVSEVPSEHLVDIASVHVSTMQAEGRGQFSKTAIPQEVVERLRYAACLLPPPA
jgi:hypothetical protein